MAASRLSGATREVYPRYERLTFDRAVALQSPLALDGAAAPEAELCGPGHPLFDAVIDAIVEQTRADVDAGAVFGAPDIAAPVVVFFVAADSVDGNGETAHRAFASITETLGGTLAAERVLLYDLIDYPGEAPRVEPVKDDDVISWARRHEFERHYQRVRAERERAAYIAEDYLTRAFSLILSRQQETLFDLDTEIEAGVSSASGRLRQAELDRAGTETKRDRRLSEVRRARNIKRGTGADSRQGARAPHWRCRRG